MNTGREWFAALMGAISAVGVVVVWVILSLGDVNAGEVILVFFLAWPLVSGLIVASFKEDEEIKARRAAEKDGRAAAQSTLATLLWFLFALAMGALLLARTFLWR